MPITELRDGLSTQQDPNQSLTTVQLNSTGFGILQKKVSVTPNMRHKLEHCDFFIDSYGTGYIMAEFYVTPYPLLFTEMQARSGGPGRFIDNVVPAYNENILYKAQFGPSIQFMNEFPNNFLAARPTFNFYTDTLYLTVFFTGQPNSEVEDFIVSFYAALDATEIDAVEHGIGLLKERMDMLISRIDINGRAIVPADNVGQVAPFWAYGGIRPESMITGTSLVNFWLNMADRDDEQMSDPTLLRSLVKQSRSMVANPEAFGTANTPDWIRLYLNEGLVAGAIRSQWPPIKHADNGNVLCL